MVIILLTVKCSGILFPKIDTFSKTFLSFNYILVVFSLPVKEEKSFIAYSICPNLQKLLRNLDSRAIKAMINTLPRNIKYMQYWILFIDFPKYFMANFHCYSNSKNCILCLMYIISFHAELHTAFTRMQLCILKLSIIFQFYE